MTAPLRFRQFRVLFSGQVVSNIGDWLDFIALAVLIAYVWDYGPGALAALAIAIAAPNIFVAPFSGVFADRWPKKRVMIGADLFRAAIVIGFVVAPSLWVLLPLVFLKTVGTTFFNPAEQAAIRMTVPEDQLHAANALSQLVVQGTKVLGPALGGLLVAIASPRVAFAIDAGTFLASAAILSRLAPFDERRGAEEGEEPEEANFWAELREGIAYIAGRRALVAAIVSLSAAVFLLLAFDTLSPLAFRELGVSRGVFGLAVGAIGLGGVLGAIAVGRHGGGVNPFVLMGAGKAVVGVLVTLMGIALLTDLDAPAVVWVPVLFVVGIASAGVLIGGPTIIQRETPPELMGRVSTAATSIPTGFQVLAPLAGAALAAWQSVGFVFTVAGAGLAALGLAVLAVRPPVGVGVSAGLADEVEPRAGLDGPAETPPMRREYA